MSLYNFVIIFFVIWMFFSGMYKQCVDSRRYKNHSVSSGFSKISVWNDVLLQLLLSLLRKEIQKLKYNN